MLGSNLYTNPGANLAVEQKLRPLEQSWKKAARCVLIPLCLPAACGTKPPGSERLPEIPARSVQQPRNMSLLCAAALRQLFKDGFSQSLVISREREKKYPWVKASKQPENYSERSPFLCPFHVLLHVPSTRARSKQTPDTVSTVKGSSGTAGMERLPQEGTYAPEHPMWAAHWLSKNSLPWPHGQLLLLDLVPTFRAYFSW